jgi:hypothetical protein
MHAATTRKSTCCPPNDFFPTNRNDFPVGFVTPAAQIASTPTLCFGTKRVPHPVVNQADATATTSHSPFVRIVSLE